MLGFGGISFLFLRGCWDSVGRGVLYRLSKRGATLTEVVWHILGAHQGNQEHLSYKGSYKCSVAP